jgi:hypothetical protein
LRFAAIIQKYALIQSIYCMLYLRWPDRKFLRQTNFNFNATTAICPLAKLQAIITNRARKVWKYNLLKIRRKEVCFAENIPPFGFDGNGLAKP